MAVPIWLVKLGVDFGVKKIKKRRAKKAAAGAPAPDYVIETEKEPSMFKGKLTYTGIATLVLSQLLAAVGVTDVGSDVSLIIAGVGAAVSIYGRWRATR